MLTGNDKITILRTLREGDKIICIQQFTNSSCVKVKLGVYVVLEVFRTRTGLRIQEMIDSIEYGAITEINGFEFIGFFTTAKDYELNIDYYRSQLTTTTEEQDQDRDQEEVIEENRDSKRELAEDAIEEFVTVLNPLLLYISMWKKKGIDLEFSSHNPDNFSVSYRDYEGFRKSITRFIKLDMDNSSLDAKVERLLGCEYPMTKIEDGVDLYN